MNPPLNQNLPLTQNPPMNQNQGLTVAMISTEPKTEVIGIGVVTRAGATIGEDGPRPQI